MPWDLRAVGAGFYETAPYRFHCTAVVHRPVERVFDAIARDPAGWGDWFPGFDHSGRWLTDGPPGEGSRRKVRMAGATYEETILAWEPPHRFAFRVDRSAAPLAYALAEDYRVSEHPAGSALEWTFAIEPRALLKPMTRFMDPVMGRMLRRIAHNLDRHLPA